jgi:hypothetical protein
MKSWMGAKWVNFVRHDGAKDCRVGSLPNNEAKAHRTTPKRVWGARRLASLWHPSRGYGRTVRLHVARDCRVGSF